MLAAALTLFLTDGGILTGPSTRRGVVITVEGPSDIGDLQLVVISEFVSSHAQRASSIAAFLRAEP